jgi:hypothetical protein
MKLPDLGATSPPALRPDLAPGSDNHDAALDAAAREAMPPPLPPAVPSESEREMFDALGPEAQAQIAADEGPDPIGRLLQEATRGLPRRPFSRRATACVRCGGTGFVAVEGGFQACACVEEP